MIMSQDKVEVTQVDEEVLERAREVSRDKRKFGLAVIVLVLVIGLVGGVGYFQRTESVRQAENSESQKDQSSRESEKTPEPSVVAQSYTIEILNGSGVTGAAARAREILESAYTGQMAITTGNAAAQTGTTVVYKTEILRRSSLAGALDERWPEAKVKVNAEQVADVVLTLGK